ncbi:NitT/TauT family transport system ATP-binding protein [Paenibacillus sp. UNC496MF]|uniref:ABC transporter ATP-binding protein n=1 Tax=Paenibacillus sp. UNC496MF TaxID=1502753 RepID=UPI0008DFF13D|nr:ABC transporter ATP-binding protein [Paenibacillus sp. UNC496MF]SFI98650.1 NitT/TauT family transport system ATP-binding protein [Paenibacillus sp. UNC496MF]
MANDKAPKLSIRELAVEYRSKGRRTLALEGVNLDVKDGEFVSVVGPSGCGKSTLLKVVSGLLEPAEGGAYIDGEPVSGVPDGVGMVFQNDALLPWKTVLQNIRLPLAIKGLPEREQVREANRLLQVVGLEGFAGFYPKQLSGGMRKRVALARTFAYDPDIYLMDEPFGPLDAQTRVKIGEQFLHMWEAVGKSVLFITHDIEEAIALSDRVIVMSPRPGRIKAEFDIRLPRPRPFYDIRFEPAFKELQKEIWAQMADAGAGGVG